MELPMKLHVLTNQIIFEGNGEARRPFLGPGCREAPGTLIGRRPRCTCGTAAATQGQSVIHSVNYFITSLVSQSVSH